jgi:histidinol-phosphate aminotransferase
MAELLLEALVPDYIRTFSAYTPSKPDAELCRLYGLKQLHRLNNNENPLGPPPAAQNVLREADPRGAAVYSSGDAYYVCHRVAELFGLEPDQVLVGNGANELITFVIKAFCGPGDNIISADQTFAVYEWVATFSGFEARLVPLNEHYFDDTAILDAMDERTKILFVCNPNNPTGTYWSRDRLIAFLDAVDGRAIVVLDEAYMEFVEQSDFPDGMTLIDTYPNLIVFRSFSKMYGLAGLRIGYLAGSQTVVDLVRRTCVVYSVNTLAQIAAVAALGDSEHIARTRALVAESRTVLEAGCARMGLPVVSNQGNFMMVQLPLSDTLVYRRLMSHGMMIRAMTGFRAPGWIRISFSHPTIMTELLTALGTVLNDAPTALSS